MFSYHNTNKCYKSYTHSGKLKAIEEKISEEPMECETDNGASTSVGFRKSLRRSILPCPPPSCPKDPRTLICVICGNVEHKRNRDKYRICEYGSAEKFVNAAIHFQDEVFTRVADRLRKQPRGMYKVSHLCRPILPQHMSSELPTKI